MTTAVIAAREELLKAALRRLTAERQEGGQYDAAEHEYADDLLAIGALHLVIAIATSDDPIDVPAHDWDLNALSDGFHTFDELYEHRYALFCALVRLSPPLTVWRTRQHEEGAAPMYEGMFLAGIALPAGDISYHLPERCWDLLPGVRVLDRAPHWDGYTPADVVDRLNAWRPDRAQDPRRYTGRLPCGTCGDGFGPKDGDGPQECSVCGPAFEPDTVDGVVEGLILSRDSYSQNLDVTRAQTFRFTRALHTILDGTGGQCESSTSGIGSCYRDGRTEDAQYTADRCCNACIAHRALTEATA